MVCHTIGVDSVCLNHGAGYDAAAAVVVVVFHVVVSLLSQLSTCGTCLRDAVSGR